MAFDTHCEPEPIKRFPAVAVVTPSATPLIFATVVAVAVPPALVTSPDNVLEHDIAVPLVAEHKSPVVNVPKLTAVFCPMLIQPEALQ